MLDVHPAHHAAGTWRDFFIHIATIVVGLLIAVGLEQTVEYFHGLHHFHETREALRQERQTNIAIFHRNVAQERRGIALLENDLRIFQYLQQHPGTPMDQLPGTPGWGEPYDTPATSAWDAATRDGVVTRLPADEVKSDKDLYEALNEFVSRWKDGYDAILAASDYEFVQPDLAKMTPLQIAGVIDRLRTCLRLQYLAALILENISAAYPDFAPGMTRDELRAMNHSLSHEDRVRLYPHATALTQHDFDAADALNKAAGGTPLTP